MDRNHPLERSKRMLMALHKRTERSQKNIRRLYQSAEKVSANPTLPGEARGSAINAREQSGGRAQQPDEWSIKRPGGGFEIGGAPTSLRPAR